MMPIFLFFIYLLALPGMIVVALVRLEERPSAFMGFFKLCFGLVSIFVIPTLGAPDLLTKIYLLLSTLLSLLGLTDIIVGKILVHMKKGGMTASTLQHK